MVKEFVFSQLLFPLTELATGTRFWSRYKQIIHSLSLSDDELDRAQRSHLVDLLKLSGKHVELWQETFATAGIDLDTINQATVDDVLQKLPISQKSTFAAGFPDRVTVKLDPDRWQYLSSAGTTDRMTVITDFDKRDYLRAAEHVNLNVAIGKVIGAPTVDIPPSACNVVCGFADEGPERLMAFILWCIKNNRLFDSASISDMRGRVERQILHNRDTLLPINPGNWETLCTQLDNYLDKIIKEKKQVIRGLPHFLLWLAARAEQRELAFPAVRVLIPYGGLAAESVAKRISRAFSARFINFYGTGEVGAIGGARAESDLVDIYQDLVYLEIVDDNDVRVADGESGRIVITDLTNRAMPIIRYDIGDIGYRKVDPVSGKAQLKLLGRKQECFITSAGDWVTTRTLQNFFFAYEQIVNFKVERVTGAIYKVAIVCIDDQVDNIIDIDELSQAFEQLLGGDVKVKVKKAPFIAPETSGKYIAFRDLSSIH